MASNLYNLYASYKNREIDDEYIIKAFDYIMQNEEDLWPYIRDFCIINEDDDNLGTYYNEDKRITINKQRINEDDIAYKNIVTLQTIKHEIEHARNLQKLEQLKDDIESKVLFYSLRNYAIEKGLDNADLKPFDKLLLILNTKANYDKNPGERIAYIKSWKYIVNLLKNQNKTEDLLTSRKMLYYSYVQGYNHNRYYLECPTYNFLLATNQLIELKQLKKRVDSSDYSLDTRLLCGLPITEEEYDNDVLTKAKLQKVRVRK